MTGVSVLNTAPTVETAESERPDWRARLRQLLRVQDAAWLALFFGLGVASPTRTDAEIELLSCLAVFQVAEPRIRLFRTHRGVILSVLIKLALVYLLMGVSGTVSSSYFPLLLVPVVTAATSLGALGTFVVCLGSAAGYLSFLLLVDWNRFVIPPDQVKELTLRVLLIGVLALLAYQLAAATREQSRHYQRAARELEMANRNLQLAEAAVRRSERLAALGQLTAGLAHELRNPLGTIRASAEVLQKNVGRDEAVARELAGYIAAEVDRTNHLVTRFLDFARPLHIERQPCDLNAVLDCAVERLSRHSPPLPITIYKNYSPDLVPLALDADLMERVFYNLLQNAAQASPEGAPVTIKTRPVAGGAEVSVIDRGSGIDPSQIENIFNPFFTTKPDGVGLGLAIVTKIVDEHNGKIAVESNPGQGAVFHVFLPYHGAPNKQS
jgi:signal transduction histidine kinase